MKYHNIMYFYNKYHNSNIGIVYFSYHIPEVRIVTVEPLRAGKPCELIIKFTNPTQHQTTITILDLDLAEQEDYVKEQKVADVVEFLEQSLSLQEVSVYI